MKRALITGSEGFVGGHLLKELLENGYEVFGTTLKATPDTGSNIYVCDITNEEQIKTLLDELKPDSIFHLAAVASPAVSFKQPKFTFEVNTLGTMNILEAIRLIPDYNPRILIVGTSEEYGFVTPDQMPVTEATTFNPVSPYSVSKLATYYFSNVHVRSYKTDIVYAASFNHTGPGQLPGFISPDVAKQIVAIERGEQEPILYTGNLDAERDMSDVRDVVRAYRLIVENGKTGERYNVCSGKSIKVKKIVNHLIKLSNKKIKHKIDPARNRPSDMPILLGSHKKLTKETGWKPQISLKKTLEDLLNWYRENR